ncbi:MAG: hypothetical protein KJT03_18320, partial [Verrucomicrobiae bacterium]|nr:hypothetical protein [Verrucomicrobiae bacterium]
MKPFRYSFFVSILLCGLCLGVGWYWGRWSMRSESSTVSTHAATERSLDSSTAKNGVSSPQIAENESPANSGQIDFTPGPDELLQAAGKIQDKASRQLYLRTLLRHWIENDPSYPEELKAKFLAGLPPGPGMQHVGLEVQFARFAAMLRDSAIGDAWKLAFASHPARSEIFAQFLAMDLANSSPEELFGNSRDWNLWEQDRYNGQLLRAWAGVEPNHAYAWYLSHPSLFGSDAEAVVFEAWAEQDFEELSAHMNSL